MIRKLKKKSQMLTIFEIWKSDFSITIYSTYYKYSKQSSPIHHTNTPTQTSNNSNQPVYLITTLRTRIMASSYH